MDLIQILGLLGVGSFVGIVVKHFLDKDEEKQLRDFNFKKEVFTKAVSVVSGFANRTVHFFLKNSNEGKIDQVAVIDYMAVLNESLAPVLLFADKDLSLKIKSFTNLAFELSEIMNGLMDNHIKGEKIEDTPHAKKMSEWKDKIFALEKDLIDSMKKDLRFNK